MHTETLPLRQGAPECMAADLELFGNLPFGVLTGAQQGASLFQIVSGQGFGSAPDTAAVTRWRRRSRSNSASAANRWNVSVPLGVVVLIFSARQCNATPRSWNRAVVSRSWRSERAKR